jgi:hypothetical protein
MRVESCGGAARMAREGERGKWAAGAGEELAPPRLARQRQKDTCK